jgi:DNA-binding response OmpR family regulator
VTRVLVVEDDPDIAQLLVHYLGKAGFGAETVAGGREALAAITARPPDLLVLDLMLPQVDGLEICRIVRANDATAELPIIMLTARAEESDRIVGLELGADDYLAKPFSPNELVARVRSRTGLSWSTPASTRCRSGARTSRSRPRNFCSSNTCCSIAGASCRAICC